MEFVAFGLVVNGFAGKEKNRRTRMINLSLEQTPGRCYSQLIINNSKYGNWCQVKFYQTKKKICPRITRISTKDGYFRDRVAPCP